MQHDRRQLLTKGRDIIGAEPLWQIEVNLESTTLPIAADSITEDVFQFRTLESNFTLENRVFETWSIQGLPQGILRAIPTFIATNAIIRPGRKLNM